MYMVQCSYWYREFYGYTQSGKNASHSTSNYFITKLNLKTCKLQTLIITSRSEKHRDQS